MGKSKFENYRIFDPYVRSLNIRDAKNGPGFINTDEMHFTVPLGGFAVEEIRHGESGVFDLGIGTNSFGVTLVGDPVHIGNVLVSNATDAEGRPGPLDTRIIGANCGLSFTGPGALAFNGKTIDLELIYQDENNAGVQVRVGHWEPQWTIVTADLTYQFALGQARKTTTNNAVNFWPGRVPPKHALQFQVSVNDLTNFPAGTLMNAAVLCSQVPKGWPLPL